MGQAGSKVAKKTLKETPKFVQVVQEVPKARPSAASPSPASPPLYAPAKDVLDRPPAPDAMPIIEPGQLENDSTNKEVEREVRDPKLSQMMQQVVANIRSGPAPREGEQHQQHTQYLGDRTMPHDRHTTLSSGLTDDTSESRGRVNVNQLRELLLLSSKGADARALAEKYSLDEVLLEKLIRHVSLSEKMIQTLSESKESV